MDDMFADDDSNAVEGTANAEQIAAREAIADQADALRPDDLEDVVDPPISAEDEEEQDRQYLAQLDAKIEAEEAAAAALRRYKIRVDGEDRELTEPELIARAQKAEAVDKRLAEAAAARKQAEEERQKAAKEREEAEAMLADARRQAQPVDPALEAARTLKGMSDEEAAAALSNLVPIQQAQAMEHRIADTLEIRSAAEWAKEQFPDIWADPMAAELFLARDARLVAQKDPRTYRQRYADLATEIRTWRGTGTNAMQERVERKRFLPSPIQSASAKVVIPEQDDSEPSIQETIAQIARSRGQQFVQR